jgi:cholesterol transport system auxiliary component
LAPHLLLPICALFLASCAASAPPATFDLDPSVPFGPAKSSHGELAVFTPTATLPLDSRRIVVRTGAGTIAYLHGAQWAENLPDLVQERLIGGFAQANVLRAVGRPGIVANRSLHTDIQHFEVDVAHEQATVEIYARLVSADGNIVADKTFSATAAAANDHAPSIAAAISHAFAQVIHDIVIWAAPKV